MEHVFTEPEETSFEKVGIKGKIFPTQELTDKAEFVLIETESGHETAITEHECVFTYYVLDGAGYFIINGQREECSAGNLVVIPPGSKFIYKGKLRMLLVTTPLWSESQEETHANES